MVKIKLEEITKTKEVECDAVENWVKQGFVLLKILKLKNQDSERIVYVLGK